MLQTLADTNKTIQQLAVLKPEAEESEVAAVPARRTGRLAKLQLAARQEAVPAEAEAPGHARPSRLKRTRVDGTAAGPAGTAEADPPGDAEVKGRPSKRPTPAVASPAGPNAKPALRPLNGAVADAAAADAGSPEAAPATMPAAAHSPFTRFACATRPQAQHTSENAGRKGAPDGAPEIAGGCAGPRVAAAPLATKRPGRSGKTRSKATAEDENLANDGIGDTSAQQEAPVAGTLRRSRRGAAAAAAEAAAAGATSVKEHVAQQAEQAEQYAPAAAGRAKRQRTGAAAQLQGVDAAEEEGDAVTAPKQHKRGRPAGNGACARGAPAATSGGPTRALEARLQAQGYAHVGGADEAGRGPLAGPVVAAVCVIPPHVVLPACLINDSKAMSEEQREEAYEFLTSNPDIAWAASVVDHGEIDRINILQAALGAMRQASEQVLEQRPGGLSYLLVDGNRMPKGLPVPAQTIVKGDATCTCIAAASIIAKVTRDRLMLQLDTQYPQYGFAQHKGYGVPSHMAAIHAHGPCAVHRRSFEPVKSITGWTRQPPQPEAAVAVTAPDAQRQEQPPAPPEAGAAPQEQQPGEVPVGAVAPAPELAPTAAQKLRLRGAQARKR